MSKKRVMIFRAFQLSLLAFCFFNYSNLPGSEYKWEKVKYEKGVTVYKASVGERIAFRGVGKIMGNPEDLISIIEDPSGWKNWIENLKSGKLIEQINPNYKVFHQAISSPFPVSDRDVVYESKIFRNSPSQIRLEMKSVKHPKAPQSNGVRIHIIFTRYEIVKLGNNSMHVTFETLSEPGGTIPDFLTNWASERYPVTLFEGLRRELIKLKK
jgi:hypothetical protein